MSIKKSINEEDIVLKLSHDTKHISQDNIMTHKRHKKKIMSVVSLDIFKNGASIEDTDEMSRFLPIKRLQSYSCRKVHI